MLSGVSDTQLDDLPAWSLPARGAAGMSIGSAWPEPVTREWAWGGATGAGVRVCILDSGVDGAHPLVGGLAGSVAISVGAKGETLVGPDEEGDLCGHGTACAGIVRSFARDCELWSARVLGAGFTGAGEVLLAGLRWAVEEGFDVVNMSLSTTKQRFARELHALADRAYFGGTTIVAAAHNLPVESYPWRFASVVSVGSHEEADPALVYANPEPPVEFFAHGVDVRVAWLGGETIASTGNSFAAPHVTGICALIRSKHPGLTPFELKSILHLTSANVGGAT
jgi:subtilisin family serine protease